MWAWAMCGPLRYRLTMLAVRIGVRLVAPRLLLPSQPERLAVALDGVKHVLVVEQTHGAQFHRYLRAHYDLPGDVRVLNRPGPLPIRPSAIEQAIMEWRS